MHPSAPQAAFDGPDPAERGVLRFFYRNRRPTWLGRWTSRICCRLARIGFLPPLVVGLEVRDRVSGRMRSDAVVVVTVAGEQYIVSIFGTVSDWVHNIKASKGDAVISNRGSRRVRLELVPPEDRAAILREFVRIARSGRKHFPLPVDAPLADFAAVASQYPVYRIESRAT